MTDSNRLETFTTLDGWIHLKRVDGMIPIEPVEWGDTPAEGLQILSEQPDTSAKLTNPGYFVKEGITAQSVMDAVAKAINKR